MLNRFFGVRSPPDLSLEEIRKRSKLLVIDDQDFPYKQLFERDGYNIDHWDDVEDMSRLESGYYDLILLDIQGVGRQQSEDQGLGILRHIRRHFPAQLVIAYSGAEYGLARKYQDFFDLADHKLGKADDYYAFKEATDSLLRKRFSVDYYVDRILDNAKVQDGLRDQLRKKLRKAIIRKNSARIEGLLSPLPNFAAKENLQLALGLSQVAIGLMSL